MKKFEEINRGYNTVFKPNQLSIGIVIPIENYANSTIPTMKEHLVRVQKIENFGFKALWLRDIPLNVPSFGDAGQTFDPFTYLGFLSGQTSNIALGISSIALPLHHPVHIAKSAATVDQLSEGRLILGVASGDRYEEYPAMGINYEKTGELFREAFTYIRKAQEIFPILETNNYGCLKGQVDVLPKATTHKIPMLMTGFSQQTLEWNVENTDGWMSYSKELYQQKNTILQWRKLIEETESYNKPFMQPLYIDLHKNDDFKPQLMHLGVKIGVNYLIEYLNDLQEIGVNHVALNLRFNLEDISRTLEKIGNEVLPHFHKTKKEDNLI